jgi:hypothetical protein
MTNWDEFDSGGSGNAGPFLTWTARGTQDGVIPAQSFYLRDREGEKLDVTDKAKAGMVIDIANMATGWQESGGTQGVAPQWKYNQTITHFAPSPGEDWKRGFKVPIAFGPDEGGLWNQAGAGAWQAMVNIIHQIKATGDQSPKLPCVKMGLVHTLHLGKGTTNWPELVIVKWVDRPAALEEQASEAASADTGNGTPPVGKIPVGKIFEKSSITPPPPTGKKDALDDSIPF